MGEQLIAIETDASCSAATTTTTRSRWPNLLKWIPTSIDHIIDAEKRLLSVVK